MSFQHRCLFDPEKVFHELLGRMKEASFTEVRKGASSLGSGGSIEVRCPLARTPAVQKSLRQGCDVSGSAHELGDAVRHIFQQFQQSVSHVLDMVCLLAAGVSECSVGARRGLSCRQLGPRLPRWSKRA